LKFEKQGENNTVPINFTNPDLLKQHHVKDVNVEKLKKFLEESVELPIFTDYHYYFTHPLKPVFMGPDKVDVHEHYKIHFVSPTCMIVEIFSYCSGFMLMDTFYNVIRYRYDSELVPDENLKQIRFKTKVSVSYSIEFVKMNMFKGRVESEGLKDNELATKEYWMPKIRSILERQSRIYYGGTVDTTAPIVNQPVQQAQIKAHEEEKGQPIHHLITNKYVIILTVVFVVLLLARFNFTNCLAVSGCIGMGMVVYKLDEINERLKKLENKH